MLVRQIATKLSVKRGERYSDRRSIVVGVTGFKLTILMCSLIC